jgi:hypothetical protein
MGGDYDAFNGSPSPTTAKAFFFDFFRASGSRRASSRDHWALDVAVDEAASVGTIGGAASTMMVLVLVEVRPFWSVAT